MNILLDLAFPDGTIYIAKVRAEYGGNQYADDISSVSEITESMGEEKDFESGIIVILIKDPVRAYKERLISATNQYIANVTAIIRKEDGTIISTRGVDSWSFPEDEFEIKCNFRIDMSADVTEKINTTTWPYAATDAIGEVIPAAYNTITGIKAWKVDNRVSTGGWWLLGSAEISTITKVVVAGETILPAYYSLQSGGGYWWVKMSHGFIMGKADFAIVDVTTPAYTPVEIITAQLAGTVTVATNAAFSARLVSQGYTASNCRYLLDRTMSPAEALKSFCESFECNYRLDASGEVIFNWLNRSTINLAGTLRGADILTAKQSQDYKPAQIKNRIKIHYDRNYVDGNYTSFGVYHGASQSTWGTFDAEIEYEYLTETVQANVSVTELYYLWANPPGTWEIMTTIDTGEDYNNGDWLRVSHPRFLTPNPYFVQVIRKAIQADNDIITFTVRDYNYLSKTFYLIDERGWFLLDVDGYRIKEVYNG